jgi:hypothetical protein
MYQEALRTVQRVLSSQNDSLALKTACYIIERVDAATVGVTDMRAIFRAQCTISLEDQADDWSKSFDTAKYRRLCEEAGIAP